MSSTSNSVRVYAVFDLVGFDAKLPQHCQVVPDHPMFGQSAGCNAIDVHVLYREPG
jgi:hypothetical protein